MAIETTETGLLLGMESHGLKRIYHRDNGDAEERFLRLTEFGSIRFEVDETDVLYVTAHFSFHPYGAVGPNVDSNILCRDGDGGLRGPTNNLTGTDRNHVVPAALSAVFQLKKKTIVDVLVSSHIKGNYKNGRAGIRNWSIDILQFSKN